MLTWGDGGGCVMGEGEEEEEGKNWTWENMQTTSGPVGYEEGANQPHMKSRVGLPIHPRIMPCVEDDNGNPLSSKQWKQDGCG